MVNQYSIQKEKTLFVASSYRKLRCTMTPCPIQLDPYRDQARTWFLTNTVHQPQDWVFWKAPIRGAVLRSWIRNFPLHQQRVSWGINGYHTTGQTPLMEEHPFCTSGFFSFLKVTYQSWVAPNCQHTSAVSACSTKKPRVCVFLKDRMLHHKYFA